jgi:vancomycin permeability regulator SanA
MAKSSKTNLNSRSGEDMERKNSKKYSKNKTGVGGKSTPKFVKAIQGMVCFVFSVIIVLLLFISGINIYVKLRVKEYIYDINDIGDLSDIDCIMVLGASVKNGDTPSAMLSDRLDMGVTLYNLGVSGKLLMSGDRTDQYYDEVRVMTAYAEDAGVPAESILQDPEGYSTYESMYRAVNVYGVKKMVIVTQRYHLYRSLYIARKLGIEAYGVAAEDIRYSGQTKRDIREFLAICKDVFKVMLAPEL